MPTPTWSSPPTRRRWKPTGRQIEIARRAVPLRDAYVAATKAATRPATQPAASGELTLSILDPQGQPVPAAMVGEFGRFGDSLPGFPHTGFYQDRGCLVMVSHRDGRVTVKLSDVWSLRQDDPTTTFLILEERHGWAALEPVSRGEFGDGGKIHEVRLQPGCRVTGKITSVGLRPFGRGIDGTICDVLFESGHFAQWTIYSNCMGPSFDLLLPPGDYDFSIRGTGSFGVHHYERLAPGQRELTLHVDLEPPYPVIQMFSGRTAPELSQIKAWKNGGPIRLADLRGRVVLLEFWGYWCQPCVGSMPQLMAVYDEFHAKGLEVIAVHDNSVGSVEELDRKLTRVREDQWKRRDLPFPVAIDGGPADKPGSEFRGTTTAAYGITAFPTTLLIGRDGKLVEQLELTNPHAREEIARFLRRSAN